MAAKSNIFNSIRARWAGAALEQHQKRLGEDKTNKFDQLAALLCNLRHWAATNDVNFEEADKIAKHTYKSELK